MTRKTASNLGYVVKGGTLTAIFCALSFLPSTTHAADLDYYEKLLLRSVAPYDPWTVTTRDNMITIRKTDTVSAVLKSAPTAPPLKVNYTIRLAFSDKIEAADYRKQLAINEKASIGLTELKKDLDQIPHVGKKYSPRGAAQTAIVDKYNKLQWAIKPLPAAYDNRKSVIVDDGPYTVVGKSADECNAVLRAANSPFTTYPKPKLSTPTRSEPEAVGDTVDLRTALSTAMLQSIRYKEARLSNVLALMNNQLETAMNKRISPVIVTARLSAKKLATPVTLVSASPLPLAEVLATICEMYELSPRANLKTNQIYLTERVRPKTPVPAVTAPKAKAAPVAPEPAPKGSRFKTSDGADVRRIGE